jgi:hypothetical protein
MAGELFSMKKFALPLAAVLALLSIAGCAQYYGKGMTRGSVSPPRACRRVPH